MILIIGSSIAALVLLFFGRHIIGGMFGLYRIVPVNEAHIRVMGNKKQIFSARDGSSSYWVIPFITKLHKLPLCNLSVPVEDVKLNDKNMAKFVCDLACFINIDKIDLAVERLILDARHDLGFDLGKLSNDLKAIMESIGRTVATQQPILDIYMNRQMLVASIKKEVEQVFPEWGISLVNLEIKHIRDAEDSFIISDIERKVAAEIRRDAEIKVAETDKEARLAKAEANEIATKREIEQQKNVELAKQEALISTQQKTAEANIKAIEAKRKLDVGKSEIDKQIVEQNAMAQKIKVEQEADAQKIKYATEAEGKAKEIVSVGQANADMIKAKFIAEAEGIKAKLLAEAEGQLKLAEAMKAVQDSAIEVKKIEITRDIEIAKANAVANALAKANMQLIMGSGDFSNLFGVKFNAESGANLKQFQDLSGISIDEIINAIAKKQEQKPASATTVESVKKAGGK